MTDRQAEALVSLIFQITSTALLALFWHHTGHSWAMFGVVYIVLCKVRHYIKGAK